MANIFRRPDYQSDTTQFLNQLNKDDPALAARRLEARGTLWETTTMDRELKEGFETGRVSQKPYVYFSSDQ